MIFTFREPKGLRRIFKRKKDVTLTVLKPVKLLENNGSIKEKTIKLKNKVYEEMNMSMKARYEVIENIKNNE